MTIPSDLKYTETHEWIKMHPDGSVSIGITDHAQDLLGDMVFVENPTPGQHLIAGKECGVVESVKAASDIYAPLSGRVLAVNIDVETSPEQINTDAWGSWLFTLQPDDPAEIDSLLDAEAYRAIAEADHH